MDFVNSLKSNFFQISESSFRETALSLFRYQAENNPLYGNYITALSLLPEKITSLEKIPFMPIGFFRDFEVITGKFNASTEFVSSGTTDTARSRHLIDDLSWYHSVSEKGFQRFYGDLTDYLILAYLPSYLENPQSSLIFMIRFFMDKAFAGSSFVKDGSELAEKVKKGRTAGKKIMLIGVSYALLNLAEKGMDLSGVEVVETGGMKGRRKEMIREELHKKLMQGLNIKTVHSEYGMTELLSQAWSKGNGIFQCPPWMKVLIRETNDPFAIGTGNRSGGINVIDLANIHSCAFIETQDVGRAFQDGSFEVLGRMDNAEVRGCSLMYV